MSYFMYVLFYVCVISLMFFHLCLISFMSYFIYVLFYWCLCSFMSLIIFAFYVLFMLCVFYHVFYHVFLYVSVWEGTGPNVRDLADPGKFILFSSSYILVFLISSFLFFLPSFLGFSSLHTCCSIWLPGNIRLKQLAQLPTQYVYLPHYLFTCREPFSLSSDCSGIALVLLWLRSVNRYLPSGDRK